MHQRGLTHWSQPVFTLTRLCSCHTIFRMFSLIPRGGFTLLYYTLLYHLKFSTIQKHWFNSLTPSLHHIFDKICFNPLLSIRCISRTKCCGRSEMDKTQLLPPNLTVCAQEYHQSAWSLTLVSTICSENCWLFSKNKIFFNKKNHRKFSWRGGTNKIVPASEDCSKRIPKAFGEKIANKISLWSPKRLGWDYHLSGI